MPKDVYYPGARATCHSLGIIHPGINRLDTGIANKLLAAGFVTEIPKEKGNPFQDEEGKFCTKKEDKDKKPRYRRERK